MWLKSSFEDNVLSASRREDACKQRRAGRQQRRRRPSPGHSVSSRDTCHLWVSKHAPRSSTQLAVHSARVAEVQRWLRETCHALAHHDRSKACILLCSGPAGCGKSACVRCVCADLTAELLEWRNPTQHSPPTYCHADSYEAQTEFVRRESEVRQFEHFMRRACRYNSVTTGHQGAALNKRVILIEELPNALVTDKNQLYHILREFSRRCVCPCVIVISESSARNSDYTPHSLFPEHVCQQLNICQIAFRSLTHRQIVGALQRILELECCISGAARPCTATVEAVARGSDGDIRSAINSLQFRASVDVRSVDEAGPSNKRRKKVACASQNSTPAITDNATTVASVCARDTSLGLFRAVGKIMYAKRDLSVHGVGGGGRYWRAPLLETSTPEHIASSAAVHPDTFVTHLQHNVPHFCHQMELLSSALDYISMADLMTSSDWQGGGVVQQCGVSVACRGVMWSRQHPSQLGFHKFRQPKLAAQTRLTEQRLCAMRVQLADWCMSVRQLCCILLPFIELIQECGGVAGGAVGGGRRVVACLSDRGDDFSRYNSLYTPYATLWRAGGEESAVSEDEQDFMIEEFDD